MSESEIDLTKPLQYYDRVSWRDVTWHEQRLDGWLVVVYGINPTGRGRYGGFEGVTIQIPPQHQHFCVRNKPNSD